METSFFESLEQYKQDTGYRSTRVTKEFIDQYKTIRKLVVTKMFSREVGDMFCEIVGSDDGHSDLCDYIIWNGRDCVNNFLENPSSAISFAETMSKTPGFDGDINPLAVLLWYK